MKHVVPVGLAILVVAATAHAETPVPQQSSADLVCKLAGDCSDAEEVSPMRAKPATRGFRVVNRNSQPQEVVSRPAVSTPVQGARVVRPVPQPAPRGNGLTPASRPAAVGMQRPVAVQPANPGRADLMITFVTNSTTLTPQAEANANEFVTALRSQKLTGMKFAIEGHTDAVGTRAYNLDLSQRRAEAVVDFLVAKGVDRSRFVVHGYGFDRPIDAHPGDSAANRRVEVVKAN